MTRWITIRPGLEPGAYLGETELPVEAIVRAWWQGLSLGQLQAFWPELTRADVVVACWYYCAHGPAIWRRRWQAWYQSIRLPLLLGEDPETLALPPQTSLC